MVSTARMTSNQRIRELQTEAAAHRDDDIVAICEIALGEKPGDAEAARDVIERILAETANMADD